MFINSTSEAVNDVSKLRETLEGYIPKAFDFAENIIVAIILLIVGRIIIKAILKMLDKVAAKSKLEIGVVKFINSVLKVVLYLVLIIIICGQVGIETTSFLAILGSAGLAVGLALQGSLSNFAGGVIILLTKPFKVGDYICDKGSGQEGTVRKIDLFYTSLTTPDNKSITIPNGSLANSSVTNVTAFDKRRISTTVSIGYDSDIEKAKEIMINIAKDDHRILKDEEISAFVSSLGDSAVFLELRTWVKSEDFWGTSFDLNEKVKSEFDKNGIEIPFNQIVVHMKENA